MATIAEVTAFREGFASMTKTLKDNRDKESQEAKVKAAKEISDRIDAMKQAQADANKALDAAKTAAKTSAQQLTALRIEMAKASQEDKKGVMDLIQEQMKTDATAQKQLAAAEEAKDSAKQAITDRKEEKEIAKQTQKDIEKLANIGQEEASSNKDTKASIDDQKEIVKRQSEYIEEQGGIAKDSNTINHMNLDIAQKELDQRKKIAKRDGISKSGQEEMNKEQKRINSERGTVFGKMANGIMDMKENIGKVLGTAGKGLLGGAIFLAIGAFLQSEYFQKMVNFIFDTLIPKLKEFYDAFFGPEGGIIKGFKTLFGDDSGIGSIVLGIGAVLLLFVGFKIAGLILAVTSMFGGFGKLRKGLGGLLGKGGRLLGATKMLKGLGSSLKGFMSGITGFASKGLDMVKNAGSKLMNSAKNMAKGALDLAKKGISAIKGGASTVASKVGGAAKSLFSGAKNLLGMGAKTASAGAKVGASAIKGTAKSTASSALKVFKAFPRLGMAAKLVPGLGAIIGAGQGLAILMDKSMSKNDKIKAFGGLLGQGLGAAGFGALGAAVGTAVFPGIGTIGGGLLGGVLGAFAGESMGRKAASFLLGEETEEEKSAKFLEGKKSMSGGPPASSGSTKSLQTKPIKTAKFETVKSKSTSSIMSKGQTASSGSTESDMDVIKTVPVNDNKDTAPIIVNAPQNNNAVTNSNTSTTNSGFVEPDPMFRRNSQYAI